MAAKNFSISALYGVFSHDVCLNASSISLSFLIIMAESNTGGAR